MGPLGAGMNRSASSSEQEVGSEQSSLTGSTETDMVAFPGSVGAVPAAAMLQEVMPSGQAFQDSSSQPLSCASLVQLHLPLLDMEHAAEIDRQVKLDEFSQLQRLVVTQTSRTPHGLRLWVLKPEDGSGQLLPKHNIRAREPVEVTKEGQEDFDVSPRAVVYRVTDFELTLVMSKDAKLVLGQVVDVRRVDDDQMHWRMRAVLQGLHSLSGRPGRLRDALFAERPLDSAAKLPPQLTNADGQLQIINRRLDASQRQAVEFALRQRRLAVIHGPPGTGKTTTVVETILQHLKLGQRVLACAPSNAAVDNLLERLAEAGVEKMVRLGHPARIRESLLDFSLDILVETDMLKSPKGTLNVRMQRNMFLMTFKVVFCTLALTSDEGPLEKPEGIGAFDLVVIDECAQSLESACWLAAQRTGKLLLAGDHCQLPPTILSQPAARRGLAVSLMERLVALHGDAAVRMLCTQYRMHELIQQWPSEQMYGGLLEAAPAVRRHRLSQLPAVRDTKDTGPTLLLIDTAGCQLTEANADETGSRRNDGEADIVAVHVAALVRDGVRQEQIGVITPYKAQTARVRAGLRKLRVGDVEVHSVDGFQGREKEAVLLSLVRSNKKRILGFVADRRRINVAVTRARRQLVIVCDTHTMSKDEFMQSLIEHMRENGEVRSAHLYAGHLGTAALCQYRPGGRRLPAEFQTQSTNSVAQRPAKGRRPSSSMSGVGASAAGKTDKKKSAKSARAISKATASMTAASIIAAGETYAGKQAANGQSAREADSNQAARKHVASTTVGSNSAVKGSAVSKAAVAMAAAAAIARDVGDSAASDAVSSEPVVCGSDFSKAAASMVSAISKLSVSRSGVSGPGVTGPGVSELHVSEADV